MDLFQSLVLTQLKKLLEIACHVKAKDKAGFDWEVLDTIAQLRTENAEMRKALQGLVDHFADDYADYPRTIPELRAAIAVLAEYPAVKK